MFWPSLYSFRNTDSKCGQNTYLVQPSADVLAEVGQRLIDVGELTEAGHLVQLLPRLDVHDRQSRVERVLEVLQEYFDSWIACTFGASK